MTNDFYSNWKEGDEGWFHCPDDDVLNNALTTWAKFNGLRDAKKIIDFACGRASAGIILSKEYKSLIYHGFDNIENIVKAANKDLADYPNAKAFLLDIITGTVNDTYDAALDLNGLDMIPDKHYPYKLAACYEK